jgi:hypothetical protein
MADYFKIVNGCHTSTIKELPVIGAPHFFQEVPVNPLLCADSADIEQNRPVKIPVLR